MSKWRPRSLRIAIWLLAIGVPLAGGWARRQRAATCDLDGLPLDRALQVRVLDAAGAEHAFCCVQCAVWWLDHEDEQSREVVVTDEVSGNELLAESACFVRSTIVNQPATGNRIHVFASEGAAQDHIALAGGRILNGETHPFARELRKR